MTKIYNFLPWQELRVRSKLTLKTVAQNLGVTIGYLSRLERCKCPFPLHLAEKLATMVKYRLKHCKICGEWTLILLDDAHFNEVGH